jgi:hypothetical protein
MRELFPNAPTLAEVVRGFAYELVLPEGPDGPGGAELDGIEDAIRRFLGAESFQVSRQTDGKTAAKEIRPFVAALSLDRSSRRIRLAAHAGPKGTVRPAEILSGVLGLSGAALRSIRIVKTALLDR